jgi:hypothetical protein
MKDQNFAIIQNDLDHYEKKNLKFLLELISSLKISHL